MGCKGSKDAGGEDKQIDYKFENTGFVKFDQLFQNASTILESAEKIRGGLEDSKEDGQEIAGTDQLKDPKYVETLKVLLWSLSAGGKGKIFDLGTEVTAEKPYLKVEPSALNEETRKLYNTFTEYVNTVIDAPEDLKTSITKLQELVDMIPDAVKDAKSEIETSSMNFKEKADAMIKIKKNSEKLPKQLEKCKRLSEILKEAGTDLKQTVPELKTLVGSADEVGTKANEEKLFKPKEIFNKYHTGARNDEGKTQSKPAEKKEAKTAEKKETKAAEKKEEKSPEKVESKSPEKVEEKPVVEKKEEHSPEKKAEEKSPVKVEEKSAAQSETIKPKAVEKDEEADANADDEPHAQIQPAHAH
jgi:hypothetical protein